MMKMELLYFICLLQLAHGADPALKNQEGQTPLDLTMVSTAIWICSIGYSYYFWTLWSCVWAVRRHWLVWLWLCQGWWRSIITTSSNATNTDAGSRNKVCLADVSNAASVTTIQCQLAYVCTTPRSLCLVDIQFQALFDIQEFRLLTFSIILVLHYFMLFL